MIKLYNCSKRMCGSLQNKQIRVKKLSEFVTFLNCVSFLFAVSWLDTSSHIANTTHDIRAAIQSLKADMHELKTSITSVDHSSKVAVIRLALVAYPFSATCIRCCPCELTVSMQQADGEGLKVQSDEKNSRSLYLTLRYLTQTFASGQAQNSSGATNSLGKTKSLSRATSIKTKSPRTPRGSR